MKRWLVFFGLVLATPVWTQNLVDNPDFENGLKGWEGFWSRDQGEGLVQATRSQEGWGAQISHRGSRDWSFGSASRVPLKPGEGYQFSARVKRLSGSGDLQESVVLRDGEVVVDWLYGVKTIGEAADWVTIEGRFLAPPGVTTAQLRFTGNGASVWLVDSASLVRTRQASAPVITAPLTLSSGGLSLTLDSRHLTLTTPAGSFVFDSSLLGGAVTSARAAGQRLELTLRDASDAPLAASMTLAEGYAALAISGGSMDADQSFPGPLLARPGQSWVLPLNEGLLVPAELPPALNNQEWVLYSGHGRVGGGAMGQLTTLAGRARRGHGTAEQL